MIYFLYLKRKRKKKKENCGWNIGLLLRIDLGEKLKLFKIGKYRGLYY